MNKMALENVLKLVTVILMVVSISATMFFHFSGSIEDTRQYHTTELAERVKGTNKQFADIHDQITSIEKEQIRSQIVLQKVVGIREDLNSLTSEYRESENMIQDMFRENIEIKRELRDIKSDIKKLKNQNED